MKPNANSNYNAKNKTGRDKFEETKETKTQTNSLSAKEEKQDRKNRFKSKKSPKKTVGETGKYQHNDISWYVNDERLVKSLGSVPFNWFAGMPRQLVDSFDCIIPRENGEPDFGRYSGNSFRATRLPSVMRLGYHPIAGTSDSGLSSLNVAARALYTFVRDKNSGAKNYEAPDLLMYILAMDQIYLMYHEARRAYQILNTYVTTNRWFPTALARAIHLPESGWNLVDNPNGAPTGIFTYDNSGLAEYRARLNLLQSKISSLVVPNVFNIFKRRAYLASNIFADDDAASGQFYIFDSDSYGYWDATVTSGSLINYKAKVARFQGTITAGSLANNVTAFGCQTLDQIIKRLEFAVGTVLADQDFGVIGGDILKAFGPNDLYNLTPVEEGEQVSIVYDENTLLQIKNATFWGDTSLTPNVENNPDTNTAKFASDNTACWPTLPGLRSTKFSLTPSITIGSNVYSPAAQYQTGGSSTSGNISSLSTWQYGGVIYCTPMFAPTYIGNIYTSAPIKYIWPNGTSALGSPTMLKEVCLYNFKHSDELTPTEVVEATRLTGVYDKSNLHLDIWTAPWVPLVYCGSELMTAATIVNTEDIIYDQTAGASEHIPMVGIPLNQVVTNDEPNFALASTRMAIYSNHRYQQKLKARTLTTTEAWIPFSHRDLEDQYSAFQWAPMMYNVNGTYATLNLVAPTNTGIFTSELMAPSGTYPVYPRGAYTSMTTVAKGSVRAIHDIAIQGLLATQIINKL